MSHAVYNQKTCGNIFHCSRVFSFLLVPSCIMHIMLINFSPHSFTKIILNVRIMLGIGVHDTHLTFECVFQLTGILLGCCSRISLTSSTLCSAGQKNRQVNGSALSDGRIRKSRESADKIKLRSQTKQTHIQTHEQSRTGNRKSNPSINKQQGRF